MFARPLVFVDVETTGGMAWNSRILEIGAIRVEDGKIVASMQQVLDPEVPVPAWITRLTSITAEEALGKPLFSDMVPQLQSLFKDAVFIAHNVEFDYGFFKEEFRRVKEPFTTDKLCTVQLSRALYPNEKSHRLDAVISRHGYEVANRHRAYDDAEVLFKFWNDSLSKFGTDYVYPLAERLVRPRQARLFM